ncbi:MAG: alpha-glucosidase/alpha-galactosidase [Turicibacter sp.]
MLKITFIGAGSTIFAKNLLGDIIRTAALKGAELALFDIDDQRLQESFTLLSYVNENYDSPCTVKSYTDRKEALKDAKYVINAIQVGGYEPCTVTDFEIPKKYGLKQTIADTLGIGGIFRALRTAPVMLEIAKDMEEVCPNALFLNYTNPMAMLTGAMLHGSKIKTVGLCHSVQSCVPDLFRDLGMDKEGVQSKIAGINHMAWLLEVTKDGQDLYPEIKERALERQKEKHDDMVRYEMMKHFGYYITESSEHNAEYSPYWIKSNYPELIDAFNIPLDEYPRRCVNQISNWKKLAQDIINKDIKHERTSEYGSYIIEAMETDKPFKFAGNVINNGAITNLPNDAIVEVSCLVDSSGIAPCYVGKLPTQLAALNMTNINVQNLVIEAILTRRKDLVYQAAMLDPHTAAELSLDDIKNLCDDLFEAHGSWIPEYK